MLREFRLDGIEMVRMDTGTSVQGRSGRCMGPLGPGMRKNHSNVCTWQHHRRIALLPEVTEQKSVHHHNFPVFSF